MSKWGLTIGIAAAAAVVSVASCSNSNSNQATHTSTSTVVVTSPTLSGAQPHNQADVTFAQQMIPHHQQAIQMSDIILGKQGIDPRVVDVANQIKAAQGSEVQQMQGWLAQWGEPMPMLPGCTNCASASTTPTATAAPSGSAPPSETPSAGATPSGPATPSAAAAPSSAMMPGGMTPGMTPPGMVSDQEITALQNAEGADAGKLFLTMMIHHHQGAIAMAQTEVKSGQNQPAIALAQSIITSQQQQIDTMQNLLAQL